MREFFRSPEKGRHVVVHSPINKNKSNNGIDSARIKQTSSEESESDMTKQQVNSGEDNMDKMSNASVEEVGGSNNNGVVDNSIKAADMNEEQAVVKYSDESSSYKLKEINQKMHEIRVENVKFKEELRYMASKIVALESIIENINMEREREREVADKERRELNKIVESLSKKIEVLSQNDRKLCDTRSRGGRGYMYSSQSNEFPQSSRYKEVNSPSNCMDNAEDRASQRDDSGYNSELEQALKIF